MAAYNLKDFYGENQPRHPVTSVVFYTNPCNTVHSHVCVFCFVFVFFPCEK